jgi:hypothetical protein
MRKDVSGSYDIAVDPFRERHSGRFTTRRRAGFARRNLDALEKADARELEMGMVGESGAAEAALWKVCDASWSSRACG